MISNKLDKVLDEVFAKTSSAIRHSLASGEHSLRAAFESALVSESGNNYNFGGCCQVAADKSSSEKSYCQ